METIKSHVDYMRIKEEKSRKNTSVPEALSEEDFEEVIGSGLTSETASNRGATPKQKPKTIPGNRLKDREEARPPEKKSQKEVKKGLKAKNRKKPPGKTEVNIEHEETTQMVVTQIEYLMPKTTGEFEKQLANMKHIPQASRPPPSNFKIPATLRQTTTNMMALPPLIANDTQTKQKLKHQFQAQYDKFADKEFYKDFHFTFIPLPVPTDELPCKFCTSPSHKMPGVDFTFYTQCMITAYA